MRHSVRCARAPRGRTRVRRRKSRAARGSAPSGATARSRHRRRCAGATSGIPSGLQQPMGALSLACRHASASGKHDMSIAIWAQGSRLMFAVWGSRAVCLACLRVRRVWRAVMRGSGRECVRPPPSGRRCCWGAAGAGRPPIAWLDGRLMFVASSCLASGTPARGGVQMTPATRGGVVTELRSWTRDSARNESVRRGAALRHLGRPDATGSPAACARGGHQGTARLGAQDAVRKLAHAHPRDNAGNKARGMRRMFGDAEHLAAEAGRFGDASERVRWGRWYAPTKQQGLVAPHMGM